MRNRYTFEFKKIYFLRIRAKNILLFRQLEIILYKVHILKYARFYTRSVFQTEVDHL